MLPNRYYISAYTDQLEEEKKYSVVHNGLFERMQNGYGVLRNCVTVEGCGFRSVRYLEVK